MHVVAEHAKKDTPQRPSPPLPRACVAVCGAVCVRGRVRRGVLHARVGVRLRGAGAGVDVCGGCLRHDPARAHHTRTISTVILAEILVQRCRISMFWGFQLGFL